MSLTKRQRRKLQAKLQRTSKPEKVQRYRKALGLGDPEPVVESTPEPVVETVPEPEPQPEPVEETAPTVEVAEVEEPKPAPKRRRLYRRRKTTKAKE